jgi:predicted Holliday junction resolvase-like endonuclease
MAWYGSEHLHEPGYTFVFWGIYWAVALLLLAIAIYMVLIDLRYLRLQFKLAERELFLDTLGSEDFRREIRDAQARKNQGDGDATG